MGTSPIAPSELARSVAETSPAMLWMGDSEGKCVFLNAALRKFWGVNPARLEDFDWTSTLHQDDIAMLAGPFAKAMAERTPFSVQARYKRADGAYRTLRTDANPHFSEGGVFLGMTGVNTDITEQLAAEARNKLLMGELSHRTKNMLTVVQAVARQIARNQPTGDFAEAFGERLRALASSNDLLLKNDWCAVLIEDLVRTHLAHVPDLLGTRIFPSGPSWRIPAKGVQILGMAFYELSTNSLKYGALADPGGTVHLSWGPTEPDRWMVEWREDNPKPIAPPAHTGFGHRVMVEMVAAAFGADVEIDFSAPGFRWKMVADHDPPLFAA